MRSSTLTFDNNGNTTTDQTGNTYTYDAWNRLITVKNSGGTTLGSYVYDAQGWRVQKTVSSTTTDFYLSSQWQVIEEHQSSTVTNKYVWSLAYIDGLILRDDNSTSGSLGISGSGLGRRLYAQQDANWNVTTLLNTSGAVQERFVYDPYGNPQTLTSSGSSTTDSFNWSYKHQGLVHDEECGVINDRSRIVLPNLGRFGQRDSWHKKRGQETAGDGYQNGMNLYQYEASDPMDQTDPSGDVVPGKPGPPNHYGGEGNCDPNNPNTVCACTRRAVFWGDPFTHEYLWWPGDPAHPNGCGQNSKNAALGGGGGPSGGDTCNTVSGPGGTPLTPAQVAAIRACVCGSVGKCCSPFGTTCHTTANGCITGNGGTVPGQMGYINIGTMFN